MQAVHDRGLNVTHGQPRTLFFALWPDAPMRARMAACAGSLRSAHDGPGRWINPERYHLTLQFLGRDAALSSTLVDACAAAAQQVKVPPLDLVLDVAGSFGQSRMTCWLGCSEMPVALERLVDCLAQALAAQRVSLHTQTRLVPHVTIRRDAQRRLEQHLAAPLHWFVDHFVLIESQPPAPYRLLGCWPLA